MQVGIRIRAFSLAAVGLFAAAACGGGTSGGGVTAAPPDKQIMHVNIGTEPSTLDPTQQQWVYEASVGRLQFEALLKPKGDLSDVTGAAASSWDISSDGLTWTFHLRSDGKFADGSPVTARDFVTA
jgi:oligopeptide transport system substrate-binding protein